MLYILWGQDDYSLTRFLEGIKKTIGDQSALGAGTTMLSGSEVNLDRLSSVCQTVPFFSEKRLVIIKGFLERFEPRGRLRQPKKTARAAAQVDESQSLAVYLGNIPDSVVLVIIEEKITGSNPVFQALLGKATVKSFPSLRDAQLRQWLQKYVADGGGSISQRAVDSLVRLVGSNLWTMASEIDKLLLFTAGERIEEDEVKSLVSNTQQDSVFALVDAIIAYKAELAEQLLQRLLQRGDEPTHLLAMLARQVRMMVRAKELARRGETRIEIQQKLGLGSEFALKKTLEQANRYSLPQLTRVYHHLLETDLAIKTGKYGDELALNILVAELCQRGGAHQASGRN